MGVREQGLRESLRSQGLKQGGLRGSLRNLNSTPPETPDSVVSRPTDEADADGVTRVLGLTFQPSADFGAIGFRISSKTSGASRARLYDFSESSYVQTKDISGLSAGDVESFGYDFIAGQDYGIGVDNGGSTYRLGFLTVGSTSYPYTGTDIDIIARFDDGGQTTSAASGINDIGNPDGVLD